MTRFPASVSIAPDTTVALVPRRLLLVCRTTADDAGRPRRPEPIDDIRSRLAAVGLGLIGDRHADLSTAAALVNPGPARVVPGAWAVNHSERCVWVEDVSGRVIDDTRLEQLFQSMGAALEEVAPVYARTRPRGHDVQGALLPRVLLVEPRPGVPSDALEETWRAAGVTVDAVRSSYLGRLEYVVIDTRSAQTAFTLRAQLLEARPALVDRVLFEQVPLANPLAFTPNDDEFGRQWNLTTVAATQAWDITRGSGAVVAVIDSGCQLDHPDLAFLPGLNADDMRPDGSPVRNMAGYRSAHGTHVAGVVGARIHNAEGVAGLSGDVGLVPIATAMVSDAAVAIGIRFAADAGADVINISLATSYPSFWGSAIPAAIDDAVDRGCVICAAAGNGDSRGILAPALHPRVLAVGGSTRTDERWSVDTSLGRRGSNYGDAMVRGNWSGVSVVAPAENLPSTDLVGAESTNPPGSPLHGYTLNFWMTSAAAPHVAAVAALLRASLGRRFTPLDVRRLIEQSADKVGSIPYAYEPGFHHGTRNEQMGYGRLNAYAALRLADIYIRDWPEDRGDEPSAPPDGDFFSQSDIVIRPTDDGDFRPGAVENSVISPGGGDHIIYVRVTNRGPSVAAAIVVDVRVTPFVGLEFHYPDDWTAVDDLHIAPTRLRTVPTLASDESGLAAFTLSAADVERAAGWTDMRWHPCVLAVASAVQDRAFDPSRIDARHVVTRFNNFAQRNLSVIRSRSEAIERLPFAIGHPRNPDAEVELVIDADPRLVGFMRLWLTRPSATLPPVAWQQAGDVGTSPVGDGDQDCSDALVFLERTRVRTTFGGCVGDLTLEKGSRFDPIRGCEPAALQVSGGIAGGDGRRRWIDVAAPVSTHRLSRAPGARQWLVLDTRLPAGVSGDRFRIDLTQRRGREVIGGASAVYVLE